MKAAIIAIGDELLIGQTIDTNSAWIGNYLYEHNIEVVENRSISDKKDDIIRTIEEVKSLCDIVLITGGLGPTKDDITKETLAEYFGTTLRFHEQTFERLTEILTNFGREPKESHRLQCHLPIDCEILPNRMGTAPGMLFRSGEQMFVSMPGVPYEMKSIMEHEVMPRLSPRVSEAIYHKTIMTSGEGESVIADMISPIVDHLSPHLSVAYLPSLGTVRIRITARGQERATLQSEVDHAVEQVVDILGPIAYGYNDLSLEEHLMHLCNKHNLMLTTAESCTGGYVGHKITSRSGSSSYFVGGIVSYSNEQKVKHLGVKTDTLMQHGAVSSETVTEMATGALSFADADISVSISGIAGPTGGTEEKPVGLIWMSIASSSHPSHTFKIMASKNRKLNIEYAANKAFDMLRRYITKHYG